jgi:hypothetical protein
VVAVTWPFKNAPEYATTDDDIAFDLQECPSSSIEGSAIEVDGQMPRAVDCGRVAVLRSRRQPAVVVTARLFCKRKVCPGCGPYHRRRLANHYTEAIGDTPMVRQVVDRAAWPTMAKRLRRHGASFLRIPAPDDCYVVLATAGDGDPVTDLAGTLATAFEQVPLVDHRGRPDLARVSSSRCWSLAAGKAGGGGDGEGGGYELLGFTRKPLRQVVQMAKNLGLYAGPVADRELAPDWAEAHLLHLPPGDALAWRRFKRWIGLHQPDRFRREVRAA